MYVGYRIFISADMEGTAGIVSSLQVTKGQNDYERGRLLMTREVNAAVEGALQAGASEVVVCDGHANMQNILPEELHPEAKLVRGCIRNSLQMEGIDDSFDAVMITGAHAGAGTQWGVLDHTWVGSMVYNLRIDGQTLNEACLNAVVAGYYGVPVVMVSGDKVTIEQTQALLPHVEGAVVKEGYSRHSALSLHPDKACALIREKARLGVQNLGKMEPVQVNNPLTMEIDFFKTDMADAAELVPGVKRLSARTISFTSDPETLFRVHELILFRLRYE